MDKGHENVRSEHKRFSIQRRWAGDRWQWWVEDRGVKVTGIFTSYNDAEAALERL